MGAEETANITSKYAAFPGGVQATPEAKIAGKLPRKKRRRFSLAHLVGVGSFYDKMDRAQCLQLMRNDPYGLRKNVRKRILALAGLGQVTSAVVNRDLHTQMGLKISEVTGFFCQPCLNEVMKFCLQEKEGQSTRESSPEEPAGQDAGGEHSVVSNQDPD